MENSCQLNCQNCIFCQKLVPKAEASLMINRALYYKYPSSQNYNYAKSIEELIDEKSNQRQVKFKDEILICESEEYLSKFFHQVKGFDKLKFLGEYYKYHKEVPRLFMEPLVHIVNRFHDQKRKIEYYRVKRLLKKQKEDKQQKNNDGMPQQQLLSKKDKDNNNKNDKNKATINANLQNILTKDICEPVRRPTDKNQNEKNKLNNNNNPQQQYQMKQYQNNNYYQYQINNEESATSLLEINQYLKDAFIDQSEKSYMQSFQNLLLPDQISENDYNKYKNLQNVDQIKQFNDQMFFKNLDKIFDPHQIQNQQKQSQQQPSYQFQKNTQKSQQFQQQAAMMIPQFQNGMKKQNEQKNDQFLIKTQKNSNRMSQKSDESSPKQNQQNSSKKQQQIIQARNFSPNQQQFDKMNSQMGGQTPQSPTRNLQTSTQLKSDFSTEALQILNSQMMNIPLISQSTTTKNHHRGASSGGDVMISLNKKTNLNQQKITSNNRNYDTDRVQYNNSNQNISNKLEGSSKLNIMNSNDDQQIPNEQQQNSSNQQQQYNHYKCQSVINNPQINIKSINNNQVIFIIKNSGGKENNNMPNTQQMNPTQSQQQQQFTQSQQINQAQKIIQNISPKQTLNLQLAQSQLAQNMPSKVVQNQNMQNNYQQQTMKMQQQQQQQQQNGPTHERSQSSLIGGNYSQSTKNIMSTKSSQNFYQQLQNNLNYDVLQKQIQQNQQLINNSTKNISSNLKSSQNLLIKQQSQKSITSNHNNNISGSNYTSTQTGKTPTNAHSSNNKLQNNWISSNYQNADPQLAQQQQVFVKVAQQTKQKFKHIRTKSQVPYAKQYSVTQTQRVVNNPSTNYQSSQRQPDMKLKTSAQNNSLPHSNHQKANSMDLKGNYNNNKKDNLNQIYGGVSSINLQQQDSGNFSATLYKQKQKFTIDPNMQQQNQQQQRAMTPKNQFIINSSNEIGSPINLLKMNGQDTNNNSKSYKNDGFNLKVTMRENNLNARKPVFNSTTSTKFNANINNLMKNNQFLSPMIKNQTTSNLQMKFSKISTNYK